MLLQARQDDDGAEAVYKRALRCDPAHLPSLFNLANLLRNVRQVGLGYTFGFRALFGASSLTYTHTHTHTHTSGRMPTGHRSTTCASCNAMLLILTCDAPADM